MPGPALQVEGARQLRASLKRAGLSVQDLKDAHRAVADLVKAEAHRRAPRSPRGSNRGPSGSLARSLRPSGTQTAAQVRAGGKRLPYAGPVHFGHPRRHIRPNPFISEAAAATERTWTGTYLAALEHIVGTIEGTHTP